MCGYFLVGKEEFFDFYKDGECFIYISIQDLQQIVSDNFGQVVWLVEVEEIFKVW